MAYKDYFKSANVKATIDEKVEIIKHNNNQALHLRKQIATWGGGTLQVPLDNIVVKGDTIPDNRLAEEVEDDETNRLYNKISLLEVSDLSEEELTNKIRDLIGTGLSPITIGKIKLLLYKDCILYNKMLLTATEPEEIEDLRQMFASLRTKIDLLDEIEELVDEEELSEPITENNNIFFLLSDSGNIITLESLRKNIPRDYYPAIKELILSLKSGKIKDVKRLTSRNCYELRGFTSGPGLRVFFDRLSNGNYIILDIFMKKIFRVRHDNYYRNALNNRVAQYLNKKESYLKMADNPEFIKEHEGYMAEILNLLDSRVLEGNGKNETRSV